MACLSCWKRTGAEGDNWSAFTGYYSGGVITMELKGKKVIIIGERDGVQGPAIEACIRSAGAEPLLVLTQCFV